MTKPSPRQAKPPLEIDTLRTRDGHRVSFAIAGAADGVPIAVLHGGPGSGSQPGALRLFDLARFRVVLIDQRGTGASTPHGSIRHNRTDHLIDDLEAIRMRLGFERWGVLGGSWGAALALAYAGQHPQAVLGVVLRGLFLTSAREVRGLFVRSRRRAPRASSRLCVAARCDRPAALLSRCHTALQDGANPAQQRAVALAWRHYEEAVLGRRDARQMHSAAAASPRETRRLIGKYRIQAHYLAHRCWLGETRLLELARNAARTGVPLAAVHGTRDPVCPRDNLRRLAHAVPTAQIEYVPGAGHLASDPALHERVARALETMFIPSVHEGRAVRRAA
ncbi:MULTISPECIES: alpha/beta fold hydrolase [Paraburkholderia]|uniref:alpha/beta fold hydrolase n=1 Tax=Paraburkholderia TaxID=1822464 RepID=UPI002253EF4D|nr:MULTISPECIES: alpha/beta fold hydrolase [Paraburkholderia]MCX4163456.1 alpha/beta fold hydrolase [Paraburkholderia megapolitana]MDN7158951.1 alpha/beta fold hydrolase [Paraburkholderia sp. CHISQ3]MDQ6495998.1 alpha/beta fold hydrolase [Paraburkholderia megapolitana]